MLRAGRPCPCSEGRGELLLHPYLTSCLFNPVSGTPDFAVDHRRFGTKGLLPNDARMFSSVWHIASRKWTCRMSFLSGSQYTEHALHVTPGCGCYARYDSMWAWWCGSIQYHYQQQRKQSMTSERSGKKQCTDQKPPGMTTPTSCRLPTRRHRGPFTLPTPLAIPARRHSRSESPNQMLERSEIGKGLDSKDDGLQGRIDSAGVMMALIHDQHGTGRIPW